MHVLLFSFALFSVDPAVTGTWAGDDGTGTPISFTIEASGKCGFYDEEDGTCSAKGGQITYRGEDFTETYSYSVSGRKLTMSGGDLQNRIVLTRTGGAATSPAPAPTKVAVPEKPSAPVKPSGNGTTIKKPEWGVSFAPPAGWKVIKESADGVAFGHDSEAGLMLIAWAPNDDEAKVRANFARGLAIEGLSLRPVSALSAFAKGGVKGLAGELSGTAADGAALRAHAIGVVSPHGGALAVMGMTTDAHFPTIKARAEQLTSTVKFTKPKIPPVNKSIAGRYWFFTASSGGSSDSKITLCDDGRYFRGGEMSGSNAAGSAYAANTSGGRWTSSGTAERGTLTLTEPSGETQTTNYALSTDPKDKGGHGQAMFIGSRKYQKTGNGNCN